MHLILHWERITGPNFKRKEHWFNPLENKISLRETARLSVNVFDKLTTTKSSIGVISIFIGILLLQSILKICAVTEPLNKVS